MKVKMVNQKTQKVQAIDQRLVPLFEKGGKWSRVQNLQMKAEVAEPDEEEVQEEDGEISERTGKPKRQYKRRDMQAED